MHHVVHPQTADVTDAPPIPREGVWGGGTFILSSGGGDGRSRIRSKRFIFKYSLAYSEAFPLVVNRPYRYIAISARTCKDGLGLYRRRGVCSIIKKNMRHHELGWVVNLLLIPATRSDSLPRPCMAQTSDNTPLPLRSVG